MFRIQSPSPTVYVERRLTPRRGDGGAAAPARIHRERDFGVGYGSSSGYASAGRSSYVRGWRPGVFKFG